MAYFSVILLGLFGVLDATYFEPNSYENHTLVQLVPNDFVQLTTINQFKDPEGKVEILKPSREVNDSLDMLVPPSRMRFIHEFFDDKDIKMVIKQKNYGRVMTTMERMPKRRTMHNGFDTFEYHSYDQILNFQYAMAKRYPELVTLQNLGNSYEGRPILLVKISSNPSARNPIIFIDAGIHAREWVAPAMALYLIQHLVYDSKKELDGVDWYILPVVNPDGYEYTRSSASKRMWRKTRSHTLGKCFGVDGNRNYGFKWALSGVSQDPCDEETYAGPKPFSEVETKMVRSVMLDNANRIKVYVSVHAYGQYLVYPWGYTGAFLPKQWRKLDSLARRVSEAVVNVGGKPFSVLSAGKWYPAAGGSDDFAFGAVGIPYSYTMELTTGHQFIFPEQMLRKVLPQFYEGFKVFGDQVRKEFSSQYNNARAYLGSDIDDAI